MNALPKTKKTEVNTAPQMASFHFTIPSGKYLNRNVNSNATIVVITTWLDINVIKTLWSLRKRPRYVPKTSITQFRISNTTSIKPVTQNSANEISLLIRYFFLLSFGLAFSFQIQLKASCTSEKRLVIQNYGNDPGNLCAKRTVLRKHNLKHLLDLSGSNITNQGAYFRKYFSFHRLFAKKVSAK